MKIRLIGEETHSESQLIENGEEDKATLMHSM